MQSIILVVIDQRHSHSLICLEYEMLIISSISLSSSLDGYDSIDTLRWDRHISVDLDDDLEMRVII